MKNWMTTIAGVVLIAISVVGMGLYSLDKVMGAAIITAGLGLVAAKDSNVTGGTRQQ